MVVSDVGDLGEDSTECPFCAEPIRRKALKCKHCGEFLNKAAPAGSETSLPSQSPAPAPTAKTEKPKRRDGAWPVMVLLTLVGMGGLALTATEHPAQRQAWNVAIAAFVIVGPIAWRIGDVVRRIATPRDVFVTGGFYSILKQKLFWRLGPQAFAMLWAAIGVGFIASSSATSDRSPAPPSSPAVAVQQANPVAATPPEPSETPSAAKSPSDEMAQAPSSDVEASSSDTQPAARPDGDSSIQASATDDTGTSGRPAKRAAPSDSDYTPDPYPQAAPRW